MARNVVVGNSVASLVAADALAARGADVELLLTGPRVGGGFAPIDFEGRSLELGVRLLELDMEGVPAQRPPLAEYRPGPNAHRDFVGHVRDWVVGLLGTRLQQVSRPQMVLRGRTVDDLYFTTDPAVLADLLSADELVRVAQETGESILRLAADSGVLDASRAAEFEQMSLFDASIANHGPFLHELLVAPVADKFAGADAAEVLAPLRRKIWLPLFWPATVRDVALGRPAGFVPDRPFHTVTPGGTGDLVTALVERLSSHRVLIHQVGRLEELRLGHDGAVILRTAERGDLAVAHPIIGVGPEELFRSAGVDYAPKKARTVICWLEAPEAQTLERPSLVNVVDADNPAVRISTGGRGRPGYSLFTVELRHDIPDEHIESAASAALRAMELVSESASLECVRAAAMPSFPLPTATNVAAFARARETLARMGYRADFVGGSTSFGSDALSDQIVQGLQVAEERTQ